MEISVTRALTELKTLDKRIQAATTDGSVFVSVSGQLRKPHPDATGAVAKYQHITDLIERRRKLKSLLTLSNATIMVKICDMEMSVAEAIEMKSSIKHKKTLLNTLKRQHAECLAEIENANEMQRNMLQKQLGSKDKDGGMSLSAKELSAYSDEYMKVNGLGLYDPINVKDKIVQLENFITEFESQVDHVLSEKNATTLIRV